MKNLLIASTALVATAGMAFADGHAGVSVGGNGYMGIATDNDATSATYGDALFKSRIRITFSASGETDGGLTFGGSVRADNSVGGAAGTGGSVYLAGASWKATMGDIDGAMEKAVGDIAGVGYTGNGDFNETQYITGGDDEGLLLQFATGPATIYASVGQRETGTDEMAIGVSFAAGDWTIGAGYEDADLADSHYGVSVAGDLGSFGVKAMYSKFGSADQMGLSATYSANATTVSAFFKNNLADDDIYGLGVAYDLGGGAAVKAGYSDGDIAEPAFDLGVTFSF